ncbi:TonB family protein [Candidatus Fermentibacteria bacterium]|nr:TonB family protein [Candidatus Fermentibacteria bacterium]
MPTSKKRGPDTLEIGLLAALALVLLLFEAIPAYGLGRLSRPTNSQEMTGYDPGELYEVPPELEDEDIVDVDQVIDRELQDIDQQDQVISMDQDTALDVVDTVDFNVDEPSEDPDGIPEAGTFIPRSVEPVCTRRPAPDYPEIARQAGVEGRVTIQLYIDENGHPVESVLAQSSGVESMNSAALEASMQTFWTPAKKANGQPVGVWVSVIYNFTLGD